MNIVITGASRGIGKALAEKFASEQHNLLLCSQGGHALYQTLEALQVQYPMLTIKAKATNLADINDLRAFTNWALQEAANMPGGSIDVLVNNAGKYAPGKSYSEDDGVLEEMLNVNLMAAYRLSKAFIPKMIENKRGHIFNICSVASLEAHSNAGSYGISKYALLGLTKTLRQEMKEFGVKVTAILPGAVFTDSWHESGLSADRFVHAEDIANTIYQCSQLSKSATVEEVIIRPQEGDI